MEKVNDKETKGLAKTRGRGKASLSFTDLEQAAGYASVVAQGATPFNSPVSIHFHSTRKRLVDADSVSAKAVIDGIVHAGLLQDDSPQFVAEVSYSQEKTGKDEEEETIVTIQEL